MPQRVEGNRVLLSTADACEIAEVSSAYIQRLLREKRIEGTKLGRDWLVYEDSLKAFLNQPRKRGRPRKEGTQLKTRQTEKEDYGEEQEAKEIQDA